MLSEIGGVAFLAFPFGQHVFREVAMVIVVVRSRSTRFLEKLGGFRKVPTLGLRNKLHRHIPVRTLAGKRRSILENLPGQLGTLAKELPATIGDGVAEPISSSVPCNPVG